MFDIAVPAMIGVALIVVLGIVFTILYTKRTDLDAAALMTSLATATEPVVDPPGPLSAPLASHTQPGEGPPGLGGSPVPID